MAASAAVSAIKRGCEMLQEGKAIVESFKEEVGGVVGEATEVKEQLTGLFSWAKSLYAQFFGNKEEVVVASVPTVVVKKKKKQKEEDPDPAVLQFQTIAGVSDQLGKFFDIQKQLKDHYRDLEEESSHVYSPDQNSAIKAKDRVFVQLQLEEMSKDIRETMVYAPKELKDFYSRFLEMYGRIEDEQEFARLEQLKKARYNKWLQDQLHNSRVDRAMALVAVVLTALWVWMILLGIVWQSKMQTDFW